jgi:[acyl-carrier-protein] S-malonyltransferase
MGRDLVAASDIARRTFEEADDVLGFALSTLCFDGPEPTLTATSNAQPAILAHSVAVLRALAGRLPDVACAAGHSLGEFSAYVAAGSLSFADALRTVRRRGELMQRSGADRPGGMAALLGLDDAAVEEVCARASELGGSCVAANYNAPGQLVISGDVAAVERALGLAREAGAKRAIPLNVSGAFHSPLMEVAEPGLRVQLDTVALAPPAFPVVSNVTARPVHDPVEARRLLLTQLTSPVRWTECVRTMHGMGVASFLEIGPGNVLSGLLRRIERSAGARALGTADDVLAFAA